MKAARYLERRLLHSLALLIVVSLLAFFLSQLAPGSFLDELKLNPQISQQTIDALRVHYGLDQPVMVRYFRWLRSAMVGDFGYSVAYNLPVNHLLWGRMRATLLLGTSAMLLAWLIALPLGIWSAHSGGFADRVLTGVSTVLLGTPELALGLIFLLIAARLGDLPVGGMSSVSAQSVEFFGAGNLLRHLLIPAVVLALASFPVLFRHVRGAMRESLHSPFIQAARGHGIGETRLLLRHALPAAANPLISLFGLSLAALVSGSLLVEVICGWPGLGPMFIDAIYARDVQIVLAVVMLFSAFLVISNFIADLLLYATDPRVRAEC